MDIFGLTSLTDSFLFSELKDWFMLLRHADLLPSLGTVISIPLILAVYLASAFISSTMAEMKLRGRLYHFIGGLILPVIYPALLHFMPDAAEEYIETRQEADVRKRQGRMTDLTGKFKNISGQIDEEPEDAEYEEGEEDVQPSSGLQEPKERRVATGEETAELKMPKYDKLYFATRTINEDGSPGGPYVITMDDGRQLTAQRIIEATENVLIFEMFTPAGESRTIRLMYEKIKDCQLKY